MAELLAYFEGQVTEHKALARSILDAAETEGRALSDEEKARVKDATAQAEHYRGKANDEKDKAELRKQIEDPKDLNGTIPAMKSDPGLPATVGEAYVASGAFKAVQDRKRRGELGQFKSEKVQLPHISLWGRKVASSPLLESNHDPIFGDGTAVGALTTVGGLETPGFKFMRLVIADLMTSIPITSGNSATYPVVLDRVQMALSDVPVAEGANKTALAYEFDVVVKQLQKIAGYTKISEEFLEDAPAVVAYINADLPFQIRQAEELYLADVLYDGVATAAALSTGTTKFDEILAAKTEIEEDGFEADGMIISPSNWAELLAEKFTGGDEHYIGGGPFTPTMNPWNLRVVVTKAATDNLPLVGAFGQGAKVYRKGGVSVESTNSDGTDFIKNLVTIRAEERLVCGVTYPEAFRAADIS